MSDFAKNLRYYRKQKRLSQAELAKALNYGDTTISNYESGRNEPSFDDLINLSHKLSVTPNDLIVFCSISAWIKSRIIFLCFVSN